MALTRPSPALLFTLLFWGFVFNPASAQNQSTGSAIQRATLMEQNQKTPEISTEELARILAELSATVFDARPFLEYAISHIPGAVNVSAKPGVPISIYVSDVAEIGCTLKGN